MADEKTPNPGDLPPSDIKPVSITDELSRSYLDYAMSVIVARALPDVRDGLKPVHRRILYSMHEQGYEWNKPYRKSARVVGDVIGKYHPHGDQSVYDALVRMAQDFSMRVELVDGQGNFGSVDGDPPAAMRYTEVRLEKIANALVDDLDKQTVDFQDNYDGSEKEPVVLPARFPNLLVNGAGGIAVGMATNIPPHNLGEVIDACIALIDKPDITLDELAEIVPGPDFPTGGIILGKNGIRQAYHTGRGSIMVRGRVAIEKDKRDRESIIVSEIPYQVNKSSMIERIAELVRDKKIDGIGDIRDESSRDGMRVVVELKREAIADIVLNQLYRFTALQSSFPANIVALTGGRPATMNLHDLVSSFVAFREDVIGKRTKFLLNKARDRAHILVGLAIAVANIDEVIKVIRSAKDPQTARDELMSREWQAKDVKALVELIDDPRHKVSAKGTYKLSEEQARAILDLRLQRLTALGRDEIAAELDELGKQIADYLEILRSRARIQSIIKGELTEIKNEFATPRKTEISGEELGEIDEEALIAPEDMVVTVSHAGYVKRVPLSTYRAQRRGGKGRAGMQTREEDFVSRLFVASTLDEVLFFSSKGRAYTLKVWKLPLAAPQARGKAFVNLLPIQPDEAITSIITMPSDNAERDKLNIMFATTGGTVRRNALSDFVDIRRSGIIAMKLAEGESIADVALCTDADDILLSTAGGQCIRFPVSDVRVFKGRDSTGVRGIKLDDDKLISMAIIRHIEASSEERIAYLKMANAVRRGDEADDSSDDEEKVGAIELSQQRYAEMGAAEQFILTLTEHGYGKRTSSFEYRITGRGGKGIVAMTVNKRNGPLVASFPVEEGDQIMLVTDGGKLIRTHVEGIRIAGRSTQGVTVFDTGEDEKVVSVERIREEEEAGNGS
ncbi:MAG: DNA gyrase subunit A [Xanthobacteraceae bacterium]|nr:DNA gyrase subunit A [Xanthobacteraceae bacterium]QYK46350.1 MAG: DNA gyrase subunit A [Xanthobacteraceae bacterium]